MNFNSLLIHGGIPDPPVNETPTNGVSLEICVGILQGVPVGKNRKKHVNFVIFYSNPYKMKMYEDAVIPKRKRY